MLVRARESVHRDTVTEPGARKAYIRWLITKDDGAPTFAMREIEVAPGGHTPYHSHPWEHEIYVLEGVGIIACKGGWETTLGPGSVVFIPGGDEHNIKNYGRETLRFLCLIPHPPA
jgi:quercetin dioxygenase-like cupin family protein